MPQFYFRRFSNDGRSIAVLLRRDGKVITQASIAGQASGHKFYGESEIETILGEADAEASVALRALDDCVAGKGRIMEMDEYPAILAHVGLQQSRTSTARSRNKAMSDRMAQLFYEIEINKDEELSEETKEEFRSLLPYLESAPEPTQLMLMQTSLEAVPYLQDLTPKVLVNRTKRPFVFSDSPVVMINLLYREITIRGVLGYRTPGLIILLPLSPSHLLMLFDEDSYDFKGGRDLKYLRDLKDVAALNKLQIHNALSAIYFGDQTIAEYLQALWREESGRLTVHAGKVVEAPGFDTESGSAIGEVMHSFQPQLNYLPDFSFLRYSPIPENHYSYRLRGE